MRPSRTRTPLVLPLSRRRFLGAVSASLLAGAGLNGCAPREPLLRVATNVWPGYELLYLAEKMQWFPSDAARMVAMPSATACLQALASGSVEAAGLTLDEVLSARADNLPLVVVAVFDISAGADMLLVSEDIKTLADLRGKRIGVEQTAVGAVMMDAILSEGGLHNEDVELVYATVDEHSSLFLAHQVDALVTFEPVPTQLQGHGVTRLYDSSRIPGRIIDVLAVRPDVLQHSPHALRQVIAGHFSALQYFRQHPAEAMPLLAPRLGIAAAEVERAYAGLELPDLAANHRWLGGAPPRLQEAADNLQEIMWQARLLSRKTSLQGLFSDAFLPEAG